MRWTILNFGKHAGRSLPEIILSDADWFFWALNKAILKGRLADEAAKLAQRARTIKIPKANPERWRVEYSYADTGKFCGFSFVKAKTPFHYGGGLAQRLPFLDLSCIRRGKPYDKGGCR